MFEDAGYIHALCMQQFIWPDLGPNCYKKTTLPGKELNFKGNSMVRRKGT